MQAFSHIVNITVSRGQSIFKCLTPKETRARFHPKLGIAALAGVATALIATPVSSEAETLFEHPFSKERADAGSPDSFSVYGTQLQQCGVTRRAKNDTPQSTFIAMDMEQDSWGVILLHDPGQWDLSEATLSISCKASDNFAKKKGFVGFKVIDSDGSEYRTHDADLFRPTKKFQTFSQPISELQFVDQFGDIKGLDVENIVQYGIVMFDQADLDRSTTIYLDDFIAARGDPSHMSQDFTPTASPRKQRFK